MLLPNMPAIGASFEYSSVHVPIVCSSLYLIRFAVSTFIQDLIVARSKLSREKDNILINVT
jgi:hypothetical protein